MSRNFISAILLLSTYCMTIACSDKHVQDTLDHAESLMEEHPDSSLTILYGIDKNSLTVKRQMAQYALLMSMALDKNYIDTTTFNILQPAIDYFIDKDKGNADEKLRTHYYQGRIYQNKGDESNAMSSFIRASETKNITDTLTLARTHVAMSVLSYYIYDPSGITSNSLLAADLYNHINRSEYVPSCYLRALEGSLLSDNRNLSDSILNICNKLKYGKDISYLKDLQGYKLSYALKYGNNQDIRDNIETVSGIDNLPDWIIIEIARGYLKLGETDLAKKYINLVDSLSPNYNTEKYLIIKSDIYESIGNYKESLELFKEFYTKEGEKIMLGESYDLSFVKEQHAKEIRLLVERQRNNYIIYGVLAGIIILSIIILMLGYRHKLIKTDLDLSNAQRERLETEKKNAELEWNNQVLINENKDLQLSELQNEIDSLKKILESKDSMLTPIKGAISERIEVLNGIIASAITSNPKYSKIYNEWKEKIIRDHKSFMTSTHLAFKVSHPAMIEYLEKHGLTESEINYACLYALGLNGKEIGKYIHSQRHYHISSDIRKKLGLDINNTNLGNYIRKLMATAN